MAESKPGDRSGDARGIFGQALVELGPASCRNIDRAGRRPEHLVQDVSCSRRRSRTASSRSGIAEQNLFGIAAGLALEGFHSVSLHLCRVCRPPRPGPDRHLDLLPRA